MHTYRSLHVMAIDAGKGKPFLTITLVAGSGPDHTCTARKTFDLDGLAEVRDLIDWSAEAYAQAFDQLTGEGGSITHHEFCHKGDEVIFGA